jgi:tRNA pseudouridine38-40 synthase
MNLPGQKGDIRNLLLRVAYDGGDFCGWQIQPQRPTIQGTLGAALEQICGEKMEVCGSGRTDAGVHACGQAANIKLSSPIPCPNLVKAVNRLLPESIRVLSAQPVPDNFHARYHARSKTYRYRIFRGQICPPWLCRYVLPYSYPLDEAAIVEAAKYFQGTLDFRSFAAVDEDQEAQEKSCVRTVFSSVVTRQGEELVYTIQGNGFLRHMVRNIAGTLIEVGRGRIAPEGILEILAAQHRSAAGPTAPARGLHLVSVSYPADPDPAEQPSPLDKHGVPIKIE